MAMEIESLQKPVKKLRKSLKSFPEDPSADDVHKLRIQSRRLEALAAALALDDVGRPDRLQKEIKPLRKAAGSTRDMDVLTANALKLSPGEDEDCLLRLIEHLGNMRTQSARDLTTLVAERRKDVRSELKTFAGRLEDKFDRPRSGKRKSADQTSKDRSSSGSAAVALDLVDELREWPRLNAHNLHPFRIKVKLLRYVLEFGEECEDGFAAALGDVKDQVGDWHDWQQLSSLAAKILAHPGECPVKKRIAEIEAQKLKQALATANTMRERYFGMESRGAKPARGTALESNEPVMRSVAKLAG
jgi:CHAD domain-containing protein